MKRFMLVFLLGILFSTTVLAAPQTIDLDTITYDEAVALKDQLNLAIWNSAEWQEVTVPQGIYEVGVDIPAGHWTIVAAKGARSLIKWVTKLNETKTVYSARIRAAIA